VVSGLELLENEMVEEEKQKRRDYMRIYRTTIQSPLQKLKEKEVTRKRMANWRATKSEEPKTRKAITEQRMKMRLAQQQYRASLSEEKKLEIKERRKQQYRAQRIASGKMPRNATTEDFMAVMPKTPDKFLVRMKQIISSATPNRKKALIKEGLIPGKQTRRQLFVIKNLTKELRRLKWSKKKQDRADLKRIFKALGKGEPSRKYLLRTVPLKWNSMMSENDPKKHGNALSYEASNEIQCWYQKNSTCLALKKTVLRSGEQKMILNTSIKKLHQRWDGRVSLSKFHMLRPKHVLTMKKQTFNSCLCDVCLSISNKLRALKPHLTVDIDKYDLVDITLCPLAKDSEYRKMLCIKRDCPDCGVHLLQKYLSSHGITSTLMAKKVKWHEWENRTYRPANTLGKTTKSPSLSKKVLVDKEETIETCIRQLLLCLGSFALHLFNAKYQAEMYNKIKESPPIGTIVTCEDFAENWRTKYQDEITSVHYCYEQATVFTTTSSYKCPTCKETVAESIIFISKDLKHDAYFVQAAHKSLIEHFKLRGLKIDKHIFFSDGCAGQFKGKTSFYQLSKMPFKHIQERNFFGSKHGKSPCDALGGILKRKAEDFVRCRVGVLRNAEELFNFSKNELEIPFNCELGQHKPRVVMFIDSVEHADETKLLGFKGTQSIHQVRRAGPDSVELRSRSCFCTVCVGSEGECIHSDITGTWQLHKLTSKRKKTRQHKPKDRRTEPGKQHSQKEQECRIELGQQLSQKEQEGRTELGQQHSQKEQEGRTELGQQHSQKEQEGRTELGQQHSQKEQEGRTELGHQLSQKEQEGRTELGHQLSQKDRIDFVSTHSDPFSEIQRLYYQKYTELQSDADMLESIINKHHTLPKSPRKDLTGVVDECSWELMPDDAAGLIPLKIYGDGNCFSRCISQAMFGSENSHRELRVRMAINMARNEELFLNPEYLSRGLSSETKNLHFIVASYLDTPDASKGRLDEDKLKELYR